MDDETLEEIFWDVDDLLEMVIHMYCFNYDNFMPEKEMIYLDYYNDNKKLSVYIHENGSITIGKSKFEIYEDLVKELQKYHKFDLEKIQSKRKGPPEDDEEVEEVPSNSDDYHDWITKDNKGKDEPPWWTQNEDEFDGDEFGEEDDTDIDYIEITNNPEYKNLGKTFTKGMDIQDFIFEVLNIAYDKGTKYLLPSEVIRILNSKNKSKESFIMWLKDRENDPDKTYGLSWNQGKRVFQIDVDDLE